MDPCQVVVDCVSILGLVQNVCLGDGISYHQSFGCFQHHVKHFDQFLVVFGPVLPRVESLDMSPGFVFLLSA